MPVKAVSQPSEQLFSKIPVNGSLSKKDFTNGSLSSKTGKS